MIVKKGIAIAIIILFIGMSVYPSTANPVEKTFIQSSRGKTLYVGGSGGDNYTRIQDAIDNASVGDTVFVYDDSSPYYEHVKVNKSIHLIGEDKDTTVIDGGKIGDVVYISVDNVTISGFTIQNSGNKTDNAGIKIDMYSNFNTISDNIIIDNANGILMRHSCNNKIEDNTFKYNKHQAIELLFSSNDNTISNNSIEPNHLYGILLLKSTGNKISENSIKFNKHGIFLDTSNNNLISNNIISSNDYAGISIDESSSNTIIGNIIRSNYNYGIHLEDAGSSNNTITGNTITNNHYGIYLHFSSSNNIIYHNNFINNWENACDECDNIWDDGKYGNYWSDYKEKYPFAIKSLLKTWMWNTPYEIPDGDSKDMCPLVNQWPKSKPRTIPRNTASYSSYLLRFLEQFPILRHLLRL